ncbi:hypothetical protein AAC387_Pa02g1112 [Persea americana]
MDSNLQHHHHNHQHQQQQQQMSSGLMRYRSAPSSLFADFIDGVGEGCDGFLGQSSSPEVETLLERFITSNNGDSAASPDILDIDEKQVISETNTQFMATMEEQSRISSKSPMICQREQLHIGSLANGAVIGSSSSVVNTGAIDSDQVKTSSNSSNLVRHSSSPAGFFSHLTVDNGYAARDPCNFRVGNGSNGETASTSRMRNQTNFISEKASFPGMSSQISDMGTENMKVSIPEGGSLGNANNSSMCYIPGYPISSWDNPPRGNNMTGLKRIRGYGKMTPEPGNRASGLSHQFSFPLTSAEMNSMEEFLEFEDSVPCNTRAKRGCATHPRSIAERVRRSRISERLRKLEELVPNMDKQTNKSDMLDLAVEYVKDLQKQVKNLMDDRASCTCSPMLKPDSSPAV